MTLPVRGEDPPLRLLAAFQRHYPAVTPEWIVQAPGRAMWVAASARPADAFVIHVADLQAHATFNRRSAKTRRTLLNRPLPRWSRYPAGVVVALCNAGLDMGGVDAVVVSEESPGPRYDYALGMTVAALIHTALNQPYTAESLLEIVDRVRREFVDAK